MLSSRSTQSWKSSPLVNIRHSWIERLSRRRKKRHRPRVLRKRPKLMVVGFNIKRRKRSQNDSKNHLPLLKVNLVQKKRRRRPGKRNQRSLNLLLKLNNLKLNKNKRKKRKKSQFKLPKKLVDCKNHPEQLANFVPLRKAICINLETSEISFRTAKIQKVRSKMLLKPNNLKQLKLLIQQRQINNLNHLNRNKSHMI